MAGHEQHLPALPRRAPYALRRSAGRPGACRIRRREASGARSRRSPRRGGGGPRGRRLQLSLDGLARGRTPTRRGLRPRSHPEVERAVSDGEGCTPGGRLAACALVPAAPRRRGLRRHVNFDVVSGAGAPRWGGAASHAGALSRMHVRVLALLALDDGSCRLLPLTRTTATRRRVQRVTRKRETARAGTRPAAPLASRCGSTASSARMRCLSGQSLRS